DDEVDIESVEEGRQGQAISQMKEAVRRALKDSRDSSDGFGSARELDGQDHMDDYLDDCKDNRRRRNHTVLERQRRTEQRALFDKLQHVLQSDPRAPRLRLLSLALKEIQNLVETSKKLEEQKKRLTLMQSLYVKQLSLLSGKSEILIKHKLKEICERQKIREKNMKWKPFFSNLLQSRAAHLQATNPQSKSTALLQHDFDSSQANAVTKAVQDKIMSLLQANLQRLPAKSSMQTPMPQAFPFPVQVKFTSPLLQARQPQTNVTLPQANVTPVEGRQERSAAPVQVFVPISQMQRTVSAPQTQTSVAAPRTQSPVAAPQTQTSVAAPQTESPVAAPQTQSSVVAPQTEGTPTASQTESTPTVSQTESTPTASQTESTVTSSQTENTVTVKLAVAAAQDGAPPTSSMPNSWKPPVHPPQPFSLPLIRSKTGRIILPSSLRP
ncbi:mucin-5AC-like, partial [Plectropomus leopardus]|uniref:mucin-5AC-like n=1 Tax=Plectropomus leopardus TaxID=160734 RepID=UPI001C4AAF9C